MAAKSHVDPCTFLQVLEVGDEAIPAELRPALLSRDMHAIQQAISQYPHGVRSRFISKETNLHESTHIAQSIIYPFIRWYSIVALKYIVEIFGELSLLDEMMSVDPTTSFSFPAFKILDLDYSIRDVTRRSFFRAPRQQIAVYPADSPATKGKEPLVSLNIIDLLENSASLIQYKLSTGIDFPSWIEFSRWSKRNPCYTNIIDFVCRYLDDKELTLRVFCALVQVSFETSRPVVIFGYLLGTLKYSLLRGNLKRLIEQPEPCMWIELFDMYLKKVSFEDPEYGNIETTRLFRFDRFRPPEFRIGDVGHPTIGHFSDIWGNLAKNDLAYRYAFTAPNGYRRQLETLGNVLTQPIALVKFTIDGENIIVITGDVHATGISGDEVTVKGSLLNLLVVVGVVRRFANALMDTDFRLCHHVNCPHYATNFCNMWPMIPSKYAECGFPAWREFLQSKITPEIKARPSMLQLKFPWDVQR